MGKTDKATSEKRVNDLLTVMLDGARGYDVFQYVREQQADSASPWFLAEGESPVSDAMIRKYITRAYRLMEEHHEKVRKRVLRERVAQLYRLYARAVQAGEVSAARAVLHDLSEIQRLLPDANDEARRLVAEIRAEMMELEKRRAEGGPGLPEVLPGTAPLPER